MKRPSRLRRRGFSLTEVAVSLAICTTLMLGLLSLSAVTTRSRNATAESDLAREAARGQLETVLATDFSQIASVYSGTTFAVAGLTPSLSGATQAGRILVDDHTPPASAALLQVVVQVNWRGFNGDAQLELGTFVADRD